MNNTIETLISVHVFTMSRLSVSYNNERSSNFTFRYVSVSSLPNQNHSLTAIQVEQVVKL